MEELVIEIKGPYRDGYVVAVNGEIILECLSEKEVGVLSVGEIRRLLKMEL